jgi:hypothetical protein
MLGLRTLFLAFYLEHTKLESGLLSGRGITGICPKTGAVIAMTIIAASPGSIIFFINFLCITMSVSRRWIEISGTD